MNFFECIFYDFKVIGSAAKAFVQIKMEDSFETKINVHPFWQSLKWSLVTA